ncbi:hypothetical protein EYF80_019119 [Liparis tanakae]|uniref:Uncharacterized protein n=1 Tax=Liparis tanakae TaxID=230148 RepID=A0A4Z2I0C7_9TELE|nr:hypothetical protein EYF80_019119 [Liparis tanakae]
MGINLSKQGSQNIRTSQQLELNALKDGHTGLFEYQFGAGSLWILCKCYAEVEQSELTFLGHCISRARLSSSSCEIGSTRLRKAAFLYKMSLSELPSKPRSYQSRHEEMRHNHSKVQ